MASRNHAKQRNEFKQLPAEVCELNLKDGENGLPGIVEPW